MSEIRRVCVYCGSRVGVRPAYAEAARRQARRSVGRALVAVVLVTAIVSVVLVVGAVWLLRALF